jgi:cytochrome c peroxidase
LSLPAPAPPPGSFDANAAKRGEGVFNGEAGCATCHKPPTYTDVLSGPDPTIPLLHDPTEVGTEQDYAKRSATKAYRATPLRGIWQRPPYFHDGSAADLPAVVDHYDEQFGLNLSAQEKADLVAFLESL